MKKLSNLREHLIKQVPELATNPDQLLTYIETGKIAFSPGNNLSHRYSFQAVVVITDWRKEADSIFIPILEWLAVVEPGFNPDEALSFEADILSLEAIDIIIKLNLTERVIVKDTEALRTIQHVIPPTPLRFEPGTTLKFIVGGPLGSAELPEQPE